MNERIYLYSLGMKKENEFRRETDPTDWQWTENVTGVAKEKRQSYFQFNVNSSSLFERDIKFKWNLDSITIINSTVIRPKDGRDLRVHPGPDPDPDPTGSRVGSGSNF